jgi:DNA polymerase-3 subunit alpha
MPNVPEYEPRKLLDLEHESVGIYISGHPYDEYAADEYKYATCGIRDLAHWKMEDTPPVVVGLLVGYKEKYTKNRGEPFGIMTFEDADSQIEAVCYSRQWPQVKPLLTAGEPYLVSGSVKNDGGMSIVVDTLELLSEARGKREGSVRIKISADGLSPDFYGSLRSELKKFPGNLPVLLDLRTHEEQALLKMRSVKVSMAPALAERIAELSGGRASVV